MDNNKSISFTNNTYSIIIESNFSNTTFIMYGLDIFIFFLIIGPQSVFGDLECVIRNDLKSSDLGIRSTALNGLKIDGGRNKTHPQVFQCHCGSDIVKKYMIVF